MRLLRYWRTVWYDITRDHVTGHTIALDLFKGVCFIVGIALTVFAAVAKFFLLGLVIYLDFSARYIDVDVPLSPGVILLTLAFGLQNSKLVKAYFDRKTQDSAGHALFTAATAQSAPPQQPQIAEVPLPE